MVSVAIVILHYKNIEDTYECLQSIAKLDVEDITLSVIIVNNSISPFIVSSINISKQLEEKIIIINNNENTGFAEGSNMGMRKALEMNTDYVCLLNNDTITDKKLLRELLAEINKDPKIGIVAPKIYFYQGDEYHKNRYTEKEKGRVIWYAGGLIDWSNVLASHRGVDEVDHGQYDKTCETDFASGCCMLIPTKVISEVGLFDERYFLYLEDSDLNERVKKKGYKIVYVPNAVVWHKNAKSGGGSGSDLQDYYLTRNRLLFGSTYASFRAKFALMRESLSILIRGRKWQKKGVIDFYLRHFSKGNYA